MKLYGELVHWYDLIDPPADHADEVAVYRERFDAVVPNAKTLLELGAGAGHNGVHLKVHYRCTLTDLSEPMLRRSRALNPECDHIAGDMRTLRLGQTFDLVLVHDAVMYMTTRADLLAAARTAFIHTRPGGAAIFEPDCVRETFEEQCAPEGSSAGEREVKFLMWTWDPDPSDETYLVDFAFLLRDGSTMTAVHDQHLEGLFSRATWIDVLTEAGFWVTATGSGLGEGHASDLFLCRRMGSR